MKTYEEMTDRRAQRSCLHLEGRRGGRRGPCLSEVHLIHHRCDWLQKPDNCVLLLLYKETSRIKFLVIPLN
jgi:hypothetical protein